MIFRCFSTSADYLESLNREINSFIKENERDGLQVVKKETLLSSSGDNSLIKPTVLISIWMNK